jgi:PKD repeat protein
MNNTIRTLRTLIAAGSIASIASAEVIFNQAGTVPGDWSEVALSGTGDFTGANPRTITGTTGTAKRIYSSTDAGIGILGDKTDIVTWSFDFSWNGSTFTANDSFSILIAATSGTFDGSGSTPADGYLFGTSAGGGNLRFGHSVDGGKAGVFTSLFDTGVSANANASGSVTITFNPTGSEWTVAGSFNGTPFTTTNATFTNSTHTGVDTSYLGPYIRNQAANMTPVLTLENLNITVRSEPPVLPSAPSSLVASAASRGRIDLSWTDNADNEVSFVIEVSLDGVAGWSVLETVVANTTTYAHSGLICESTRHYRVKATNTAGDSGYTDVASATTSACPTAVPVAPSMLSAMAISASQVQLTWVDNAIEDDSYTVEGSPDGSTGWTVIATLPGDSTSYFDVGLVGESTYYYRVFASNGLGDSAFSNIVSVTTLATAPNLIEPFAYSGNFDMGDFWSQDAAFSTPANSYLHYEVSTGFPGHYAATGGRILNTANRQQIYLPLAAPILLTDDGSGGGGGRTTTFYYSYLLDLHVVRDWFGPGGYGVTLLTNQHGSRGVGFGISADDLPGAVMAGDVIGNNFLFTNPAVAREIATTVQERQTYLFLARFDYTQANDDPTVGGTGALRGRFKLLTPGEAYPHAEADVAWDLDYSVNTTSFAGNELAIDKVAVTCSTIRELAFSIDDIRVGTAYHHVMASALDASDGTVTLPPLGGTPLSALKIIDSKDRGGASLVVGTDLIFGQRGDGGPLRARDGSNYQLYPHGIWVRQPKFSWTYQLDGQFTAFLADFALDSGTAAASGIVHIDGVQVFDSGSIAIGEISPAFIDLTGAQEMMISFLDTGGSLNVTMTIGNARVIPKPSVQADALQLWRAQNFPGQADNPAVSGPLATDINGVPNYLHFAFGTRPGGPVDLPVANVRPGGLSVPFTTTEERRRYVRYRPQTSTNLRDWTTEELPVPATNGEMEDYLFTRDLPVGSALFARLTVESNEAPVARLQADVIEGRAPLTVQFDGTGSTDPDGVFRYDWQFGDGRAEALDPAPIHTYNRPGIYEATLQVYDQEGATDVARQKIIVLPVDNLPPYAAAAMAPLPALPGETITFNAGDSGDPDGHIISYVWDFGDGHSATGRTATHSYGATGIYTGSLTVTDDGGLSDTIVLRIRVDDGSNSTILPIREGSRILIVGNSLTGFHGNIRDGLNAICQASDPSFTIETAGAGKGAGILQEYATWPGLGVQETINQGWDIVIIQPWNDIISDPDVYTHGQTLANWVHATGALLVWIEHAPRWTVFPLQHPIVQANTARLGSQTGGLVLPVSRAFNVMAQDPTYANAVSQTGGFVDDTGDNQEFSDLMYADSVHYNSNGQVLQSYCLYKFLTGASPVGLNVSWPSGFRTNLRPDLFDYLGNIADMVVPSAQSEL